MKEVIQKQQFPGDYFILVNLLLLPFHLFICCFYNYKWTWKKSCKNLRGSQRASREIWYNLDNWQLIGLTYLDWNSVRLWVAIPKDSKEYIDNYSRKYQISIISMPYINAIARYSVKSRRIKSNVMINIVFLRIHLFIYAQFLCYRSKGI